MQKNKHELTTAAADGNDNSGDVNANDDADADGDKELVNDGIDQNLVTNEHISVEEVSCMILLLAVFFHVTN
jgi:hypothetical protein